MEVSWLPLLVSAAVLAAIFLLLVVCVDCTNQGPMAHISQRSPSEDDVLSNRFIVIHPQSTRPVMDVTPAHPSSILLSPHPNSAEAGFWRPTTPTETESNPSYENSGTPPARQESDGEDTGYIIVLPENDPEKRRASTPSTDGPNCSSSSSSSSADNLHEYVNVESPGSSNYLNVVPSSNNATNGPSFSDDDDDDDDDNNYVNQPPLLKAPPVSSSIIFLLSVCQRPPAESELPDSSGSEASGWRGHESCGGPVCPAPCYLLPRFHSPGSSLGQMGMSEH